MTPELLAELDTLRAELRATRAAGRRIADMSDEQDARIAALEQQVAGMRAQIAELLNRTAGQVRLGPQRETPEEREAAARKLADKLVAAVKPEPPPVDRSKLCTTDGRPVAEARASQTNETGQHPSYIVLCDEERSKGFVRPYRDAYKHTACGTVTTMGRKLSETYARDPKFYGATFCCGCNRHLPVAEFVWTADGQVVGS